MTQPTQRNDETLDRQVARLEASTRRLSREVASLTNSLDRVNDIESAQIELKVQTTEAVRSAYEALDELHAARPIIADAVSKTQVRARLRRWFLMALVAVIAVTYLSVTGYQTYQNACYRQTHLTHTRAVVCDHVFIGDPKVVEGPQYSQRIPTVAPTP